MTIELDSVQQVVIVPFVASHTTNDASLPKRYPSGMVPIPNPWGFFSWARTHQPFGASIDYNVFANPANPEPLVFEQLAFDHPLYILFSSGTTGSRSHSGRSRRSCVHVCRDTQMPCAHGWR